MQEKKLSIAHLHWGFPPTIGGVETHLSVLLPELVKKGLSQWILTASLPDVKEREKYNGVEVIRTPVMDLNRLLQKGSDISKEEVEKEFKNYFDTAKPDIIHAHNMHYFTHIHPAVLAQEAKARNIPLMLTAHNVWDESIFLDLTAKFPWDHIITVSHFIKKEISGAGFDEKKITVVHHGIDTEKFKPVDNLDSLYDKYPMLKGKRVIFHPARISLGKGSDIAIKATAIVKKDIDNVFLVLAGSSNIIDWDEHMEGDMAYMSELIGILGLKDNIYIDSFSLDQMAELYNLTEVCVYPSSAQEPFGLTMLEAQATEKPIIVTHAGGMPEIIHDSINGYVVPIRDHEAIAYRVKMFMKDRDLYERFVKVGRINVCNQFTKEIMAEAVYSVYTKVITEYNN